MNSIYSLTILSSIIRPRHYKRQLLLSCIEMATPTNHFNATASALALSGRRMPFSSLNRELRTDYAINHINASSTSSTLTMNILSRSRVSIKSITPKNGLSLFSFRRTRSWMSFWERIPLFERCKQRSLSYPSQFAQLNYEYFLRGVYLYWIDPIRDYYLALLISQNWITPIFSGASSCIE